MYCFVNLVGGDTRLQHTSGRLNINHGSSSTQCSIHDTKADEANVCDFLKCRYPTLTSVPANSLTSAPSLQAARIFCSSYKRHMCDGMFIAMVHYALSRLIHKLCVRL